jgi:hypothetical protein
MNQNNFFPPGASEINSPATAKDSVDLSWNNVVRRRSFLSGLGALGAALPAGTLLASDDRDKSHVRKLTRGDAAILRFLAAAEIIETDLWQQYNELGGVNVVMQLTSSHWRTWMKTCRSIFPTIRMMK